MTDVILHHYDASPFAELVRKALTVKGIAWKSVIIPNMMPKPDLVELTGGYARTPVLQIGADIYCDSAAITDALEMHQPDPSLYPAPLGPLHRMIANFAGGAQFAAHVTAAMKNLPAGMLAPGFAKDRRRRFVGFDFERMGEIAPHMESQVLASASWLGGALADGRAYIGGDAIGHGDLALYSNLWFVRSMPFATDFAAQAFANGPVQRWYDRIVAISGKDPEVIDATAAIRIAAASEPEAIGQPAGQVAVRPEHSGDEPVTGTLLRDDQTGIIIQRQSERAGTVNVHFPRVGQILTAA